MLHVTTPLIEDLQTSAELGKPVWLKMECYQPIGSFKLRGIGLLCERGMREGTAHFISSSGGNAGLAVAYSARKLGASATVVVPSTTPEATRQLLTLYGAEVVVHGDVWDEADAHARERAAGKAAMYVSPFDHPVIWEGHASIIDEIAASGVKPDTIVVSVGGGGLFCGILEGLRRNEWRDVKVIAVETHGAESLHRAMQEGQLVTLPAITSIAKSLGARRVASEALAWTRRHPVESVVVSDESALKACVRFARVQRTLVEPACGAALSVVYENHESLTDARAVAVIVCGGISTGIVVEALSSTR
jgi:L-serine/L-threonine ammonia-lyase